MGGVGTQVRALGGRRKGGGPLAMASSCPVKSFLMDGPKPNSMVYMLGLSFPSVGLGRKAGEQDQLDSKAPTQTPPRCGPGAQK